MKLSVVIPAYNEENEIAETVALVKEKGHDLIEEIIVVDGQSTDNTEAEARSAGAKVVISPRKGRAAQMNVGAEQASAEILYFLHADTRPPDDFAESVCDAIEKGYHAGCFQLTFDEDHFLLDLYAWFTRFDIDAFRFGDQSLFIQRDVFFAIEGFREDHIVMEDNEIVRRIKDEYDFTIIDEAVETSARLYREVGVLKLQFVFFLIYVLYFLGVEQETLADIKGSL